MARRGVFAAYAKVSRLIVCSSGGIAVATLVIDPKIEEELLENRRAWGGDKFDEVWDGVYVMAPLANVEHMQLMGNLSAAFINAFAQQPEVRVFPGVNVSDRQQNWKENYRCPDVAVVLPGSRAIDCDTFYFGGPDFVVEIVSDYDRSREKFDFYSRVGVREMLLVDRNPWQLELYRLIGSELKLVGNSEPLGQQSLASQVLPLTFRLLSRPSGRPQIEIVKPASNERWFA
jgi:Uma2 family endonuclease